jgi:cation:H+ antiporter
MWQSILCVLGGLALLPLGAEALVRGSVVVARRFRISPVVIGLTIVAAGTSMPELVTSLSAAVNHAPGIVLGNAIGSNIANLSLILGLAALLGRLPATGRSVGRDVLLTLAVTAVLALLALDGRLALTDGLILLGCLVALNVVILRRADGPALEPDAAPSTLSLGPTRALLLIAGGLVALAGGAELLVRGARAIALGLGVTETLVGATVVAIGTSLPELAATLAAVRGKHYDLMLGNLLGSCQFNIAAIVGLPAVISPLTADRSILLLHLPALVLITVAASMFIRTHRSVYRREGLVLVLLYAAYLALTIWLR